MSLHVTLLYPQWGTRKRLYGVCVRSVLLSGCQAVSAAVRPLCAVGLSGSCQAVTLGPDSDGTPRLPDSAVRLSDTCCQTVRESAVSAVRLSGTVRRCPGFAVSLSDQGSATNEFLQQESRRSDGTPPAYIIATGSPSPKPSSARRPSGADAASLPKAGRLAGARTTRAGARRFVSSQSARRGLAPS